MLKYLDLLKMFNSVFTSVTVAYCTGIFMDAILLLKVTSVMLLTSDATKVRILSVVFLAFEPSLKKVCTLL